MRIFLGRFATICHPNLPEQTIFTAALRVALFGANRIIRVVAAAEVFWREFGEIGRAAVCRDSQL